MSGGRPIEESPFAPLARRLGIALSYRDAFGETCWAKEETLAALIEAFGLSPDPAKAARELDAGERESACARAPAIVLSERQRRFSLALPEGIKPLSWTCRLEPGGEVSGAFEEARGGEGWAAVLPDLLPQGYHALAVETGGGGFERPLIVVPESCYWPEDLECGWGLVCQLYGLKAASDWGIGDFGGLRVLARELGAKGAAVLGTNPLHALFAADPERKSPYAPSDRHWLNPLYIDVAAVPGFAEEGRIKALLEERSLSRNRALAAAAELVDYPRAAALKRPLLEALYKGFAARHLGAGASGPFRQALRKFQKEGGRALENFALFEALSEHFSPELGARSPALWPQPFRDPLSPEVRDFALRHRERVLFHQFLQWEADRQLGAAAAAGKEAGLALGLYRDLAVGSDPEGAEIWCDRELFCERASVGAPPDLLARNGQDWGLWPVHPLLLRERGFAPFIGLLRANMRHAGVLRIDHVMALSRLFWIPKGFSAKEGAYVSYPAEELLGILALESRRASAAVIGEDLGTVPEGLRQRLREKGVLSSRVFVFEKGEGGRFLPPANYPALASAQFETHDLATVKGFWLGRDLAWKRRLSLYPDEERAKAEAAEREGDRPLLLEALAAEGLLPRERFGEFLAPSGEPLYKQALFDLVLAFLAHSPARLLLVELEDVLGEKEQPNLPGTIDEHPNWRRRTRLALEKIIEKGDIGRIAALIREARGQGQSET